MHCAVPFFLCPKRNGGGQGGAAGTGEGFPWGMCCGVGGCASGLRGGAEVLGQGVSLCGGGRRSSAGNGLWGRRMCVWAAGMWQEGRGRACRCAGAGAGFRRGMGCGVGGRASRSLRACVWAAGMWQEGWGRACRRAGGREQVFGGECVVWSAGLTHFRRCRSRVRVLLYIRPPCPRREIKAMGPKDAPCEHPSPAKTSAPAPSAFIFPRPRSHFPRMAFGGPRRAIGLPQQQLSTMGYPRKSYPHRCSPPCAKRSRPRACARVYIIYRSPVGRSRECSRRCGEEVAPLWPRVPRRRAQGGGGRRQRRTPPRAVPRTFPA